MEKKSNIYDENNNIIDEKSFNIQQESTGTLRFISYIQNIINMVEYSYRTKYNDIVIEINTANGNAMTFLNYANEFLFKEDNQRKYTNYERYLVFDCDDPPNIQEVISNALKSENEYNLLISNPLFEIWLLMHLEDISAPLSKKKIYQRMEYHLNLEDKAYIKLKDNNDVIRQIISNESLKSAIDNAKTLENKYNSQNKSFKNNISKLNPYTNVHSPIEQFFLLLYLK